MKNYSKVIVTIVCVVIFFFVFALIVGMREGSGHSTPGILGIIVFMGLLGAIKAIWKKKDDNNNDDVTLQK